MDYIYRICGEEITISETRIRYNKVRDSYRTYSDYLIDEFYDDYEKNKNLEDIYNNVKSQGDNKIYQLIDITASYLKENNILNINSKELFENYKKTDKYSIWYRQVENIRNKYLEIEYGKNYLKSNEGIGIFDDADDSILDSTIKTIEGSIGKGVAFFQKNRIYKRETTLKSLADALYKSCFYIHYDYIDLVEKNKGKKLYLPVSKEDESLAEEIYLSLSNGLVKEGDLGLSVKKLIELNPYKEEYYRYIFLYYGDKTGDLERLAGYFSIDINKYKLDSTLDLYNRFNLKEPDYLEVKTGVDNKLIKDYRVKDLKKEGFIWMPVRLELIYLLKLYLIKLNLIKYGEEIQLSDKNPSLGLIDTEIDRFRSYFLWVNGIRLKGFKQGVLARLDREKIEGIVGGTDKKSLASVRKSLELIDLEVKTRVKEIYIKDLNIILIGLIDDEIKGLISNIDLNDIGEIKKLILKISRNYKISEGKKHINYLEGRITYLKTKEKIKDISNEAIDKGKEFINKLFSSNKEGE